VIRFDEPPYGTAMPGAGAVHHIRNGAATTTSYCVGKAEQWPL
jgi:hypothetical protein